jgi:uncharacterized membrane protein YgcG
MRGGRGGAGGAPAAAAETPATAEAGTPEVAPEKAELPKDPAELGQTMGAATNIPEVDRMAAIREFAALYGPTTIIKAKDWDETELEWVSLTSEEEKTKGREIVMPVSMVVHAKYQEQLGGYFPIYQRDGRSLGEIVSRETITEPRKPKRTPEELRDLIRQVRREAQAALAEAEAAEAEAGVGRGGVGAGGGMRGGGMRGGGMRGGGMRGGGGRRGGRWQ